MSIKREKKKEDAKKFLKEIGCIAIGTIVGIVTYVVCLYTNFAIFGWNFGLVLAPLFAGYAESFAAKKFVGESTGAVSAFILFIITVIYGFIIANPTLGFNIITAGSIVIIIQAAMPTATNYFLITMGLAIVSHATGIFKKICRYLYKIYLKIMDKLEREPKITIEEPIHKKYHLYHKEHDMNKLGVLLLSLEESPEEKTMLENKGIFESMEIFTFNQKEELKTKRNDEMNELLLANVKMAESKALFNLIKDLKKEGCNGLLNMNMTFETLGSSKGENIMQVVVRGTGVVYEESENII